MDLKERVRLETKAEVSLVNIKGTECQKWLDNILPHRLFCSKLAHFAMKCQLYCLLLRRTLGLYVKVYN